MNNKQKNHIDKFFISWGKLNNNVNALQCERKGIQYRGIDDPQVQIYWKALKQHERNEIVNKYGVNTENDLLELFRV